MYRGGYMGRVLRLDLTNKTHQVEELPVEMARDFVGGTGFVLKILFDEVPAGTDPLGVNNKLIIAPGPLTGTESPCSSRIAYAARSPVTGAVGMALSGGHFPAEMKFAGYDILIVEGRAKDPTYVWIKDDDWMKCAGDAAEPGGVCYAGADFAESRDLCSLVVQWPGSPRHIKSWFWIPEKKVREKEDRVDYWVWKKQGHIRVIPGDAIDHSLLAKEVLEILGKYQVQGMTYDKYGIGEAVIQSMITEGYPVSKLHPMKQQTTQYQGPIRKIEEEVMLERMNHEGHPVLQWNIRNVVLFKDSYGGVKFNKSKVIEKIDGAVALAMAYAEEMGSEPVDTGQVYYV